MTGPAPAAAPSTAQVVPFRPLGGTELIDGAVRIVWAQRGRLLAVAAPFAVVEAAVRALVSLAQTGALGFELPSLLAALLLPALIGVPAAGMLAPLISASITGEPVGTGIAVRRGLRLLPVLVVLGLVVALVQGVGLVLLVVGGVLVWGFWAVAAPAVALERIGPIAALRRSTRLVRGDFGRVWGVRALGWLVTYVLGALVVVPFELLGLLVTGGSITDGQLHRPALYVLVVAIGQVVNYLVSVPVAAAVDMLLYTDLRMRREGMDLVMALPPEPTNAAAAAGGAW